MADKKYVSKVKINGELRYVKDLESANNIKYREAVEAGRLGTEIVANGTDRLTRLFVDLDGVEAFLPKLNAIAFDNDLDNGTSVFETDEPDDPVKVYIVQASVNDEAPIERSIIYSPNIERACTIFTGAKGPALYIINYIQEAPGIFAEVFIPLTNEAADAGYRAGSAYAAVDSALMLIQEGGVLALDFELPTPSVNTDTIPPDCIGEAQINGVGTYNKLFRHIFSANDEFIVVDEKEGGLVLVRDDEEIEGQENLVDFKTLDGVSLIGAGDIKLKTINNKSLVGEGNISTTVYQLDLVVTKSPDDNLSGTVTKEQFDALYADHASCINIIYPVTADDETTTYKYCFKRDYDLTSSASEGKFISYTCNYNLLDAVVRKYQLYIQYLPNNDTCTYSCGKVGEFEVYSATGASRSIERKNGSLSERDFNRYFGSVDIAGCSHIKDENGTVYDLVHVEYTTTTPKTVLYYVYTNTSYKLKNDITYESQTADLKSSEDHNSAIFVFPTDKRWLFIRDWATAITSYGDADVKKLLADYLVTEIHLAPSSSLIGQILCGTEAIMAPALGLATFDATAGEHGQFSEAQGAVQLAEIEEGGYVVALGAEKGNKVAMASYNDRPQYIKLSEADDQTEHDIMLSDDIEMNATAETPTAANTIKVKDTVYTFNATLPQAYEDYLKRATFQVPTISLSLYNGDTKLSSGTYETGTTFTLTNFHHKETNVDSIQGNTMTFYKGSTAVTTDNKSADVATKTLDSSIEISSDCSFKLGCVDTLGDARVSSTISFSFADYAYAKASTSEEAPTSGTKLSTISSFATSGQTLSYTAGSYLYLYVKATGKTVETEVLGQWASAEFTELAGVTFTKANGATDTYIPYRVGPFAKTGSAKYRVK